MHLHRSLSSLSSPWALALCNLKRTIYRLFKIAVALSVSPSFYSSLSLSIILLPLNTHLSSQSSQKPWDLLCSTWKLLHPSSPRTPSGGGFSARSAMCPLCYWTSERALCEDPQQCHWLMLRDSPCLFKWQCCNDSRRQTDWRQDPLDYFVSDIKRSGLTQWERSRARTMSAATLKLTQL